MNLRNVLRTYALLRQLTDDESALLETLRELSDSEREQLVESLAPVRTAAKKPASKSRVYEHCTQCDKTRGHSYHKDSTVDGYHEFQSLKPKSQRATSLADQIKSTGKRKPNVDPNEHCQKQFPGEIVCDELVDANVHQLRGATGYHEFVTGKSDVPGAEPSSSASNGERSGTANFEMQPDSAGVAAREVSAGGDKDVR